MRAADSRICWQNRGSSCCDGKILNKTRGFQSASVHGRIPARRLRYRVAMAISDDRRLSDKLLVAFDQACDQNFIPVAELLLRAIEIALTREGGPNRVDKRQDLGPVIAAYARLKELQDARSRG